ncbi:MAG: site-specific integrase, partial [Desulfopila sp.]|nr:site-specific integrase [Desulfopila sp.]
MARIQLRKGKTRTTYTATIRVKGQSSVSRTFDTKGEAKSWAAEVEREIRMGRYQDVRPAENLTFAAALRKYLERVSTTKRPNSESRDRISAKALIAGFGKEVSFAAVTPQRLAEYRDLRLQSVSPSTIQKEFALISHLFNVARREWGLPVNNPVPEVRRPKVQNNRTRFLTQEEAQRLLDAAKTSRNKKLYPYLLLLIHTGMRPSEAAGLQWADVDLDQRLVKLPITKTDMRYVPLTKQTENVLRSLKPQKTQLDEYVFLPPKNEISQKVLDIPCNYFKRSFGTARKKAELDDLHLHDLRHTAASHLLMAGVDIRTLAEILGHKTMQMV